MNGVMKQNQNPVSFQNRRNKKSLIVSLPWMSLSPVKRKKVEALKAHKKALMKQLFPAQAKPSPNSAFLSFGVMGSGYRYSCGSWENLFGMTYSPDDVREEGMLVLRSSNVQNGVILLERQRIC